MTFDRLKRKNPGFSDGNLWIMTAKAYHGGIGNVLKEQRQKLLDAIGKDSYGGVNVFEGVTPSQGQRSPESMAANPLGDLDPGDAGVDISGIVALGGKKWKAFTQ